MWELIRKNRRKSFILFIMMGVCLLLMGYLLGTAFWGEGGGPAGLTLAFLIWAVLSLVSYFSGDSIILNMSGAKEVTPDIHPQLFNVVEEMKLAGSLPAMPKIYIIDTPAPNAFATGRSPEKSAIAVTAGLLTRLNRNELQGVIAHEMSHILNRDILFMTFAGIMLGSMILLSRVFLYGGMRSGGSRRIQSKKSSGGGGIPIVAIIAIIFAILAPILGHILYMAISRQREYLADASAVRLTRYPTGLASALEKISKSTRELPNVNKVTAPLFIVRPFVKKEMKASGLGSTHPPIKERIKILRAMSHGADFSQYEKAYKSVTGKGAVIPASALKDSTVIPILTGKSEKKPASPGGARAGTRELNDLMRAVNQYVFVACICGLRLKLPPDFKKSKFDCPRCSRVIAVPVAEMAAAAVVLDQLQAKDKSTAQADKPVYRRRGNGWESFSCTCGNKLQISPAFEGKAIKCAKCGTEIGIEQ